jgi:transposase
MQPSTRTRRRRPDRGEHLGKPHGLLAPRVQAVGPEHFGIVAVDPAKARSYWLLADFYGRVLVPLTAVEHTRSGFDAAIDHLRRAVAEHDLRDLVVAIEPTGRYHRPVKRAFAAAGFDTRVVHPAISRHYRQAAEYDTKTDRTDTEAGIFRAAINGFGSQEAPRDPTYAALQFWARHRRDLVHKETLLRCQVLEEVEAYLPGYARCCNTMFDNAFAVIVPRHYASPAAVAAAGVEGLARLARLGRARVQRPTLLRILGWAGDAADPDPDAELHRARLIALDDDRINKLKQIHSCERELVAYLVRTPYVRLLALPGLNVVTAGEFAGEAGPMEHYATARVITGRAGLFPRRYQSDRVDLASGRLARRGNRRLRQALLQAADTLVRCNDHFGALAARWRAAGKDPREVHVRVAGRLARIAFRMAADGGGYDHPACRGPEHALKKLSDFHANHNIDEDMMRTNLERAAAQLAPPSGPTAAAAPGEAAGGGPRRAPSAGSSPASGDVPPPARPGRGRGPKALSAILPELLKRLGGEAAQVLESALSGETP